MGIFGDSGSGKTDLVRALLVERVTHDPVAKSQGYTPFMVRQLTGLQIMSSTEAAIVAIIETHAKLTNQGVSDLDAINRIEAHRMSLGRGLGGPPSDLRGFIHYRAALEHQGPELQEAHIDLCMRAADHFFTFVDDKGEAAHSLKFAQLEQKTERIDRLLTWLSPYIAGEITDEALWELAPDELFAWDEELKDRNARAATLRFQAAMRDME